MSKMKLTVKEHIAILEKLKSRFNQNIDRHKSLEWNAIENRLKEDPRKLWSLNTMEKLGGEPIFEYKQNGNILKAEFSGGQIVGGHLIGLVDENAILK